MDGVEEIQTINWSERKTGNPYRQNIHPAMLLPEGYKVLCNIVRESTGRRKALDSEKSWVYVLYDEAYVIEKIRRDLLVPLNPRDYKGLQTVISKAWKVHKNIT